MSAREGTLTMRWRLVIEGAEGEENPDDLLEVSRAQIAAALADGEIAGEITERVIFDDARGCPPGVVPDPEPSAPAGEVRA